MERAIRVACVGDSITEGTGGQPYPDQLQAMLGDRYLVGNFGSFGAHLRISDSPYSYSRTPQFAASLGWAPDAVLFSLGTNDRLDEDAPFLSEYFQRDLETMIRRYRALPSAPLVLGALSPAVQRAEDNGEIVRDRIRPMQRETFAALGVPIVDLFALTQPRPEWFADGLHPNKEGYRQIARAFHDAIRAAGL